MRTIKTIKIFEGFSVLRSFVMYALCMLHRDCWLVNTSPASFFCFVLSKELELRLNRDDCQRRSDHFKSDSSQQTTEVKPEQFVSGFHVVYQKGMRVFHEGFQTPRKRRVTIECFYFSRSLEPWWNTKHDILISNDFSNETIEIYSASRIWHFPFRMLSYA